ncbi:hypothetical protein TWF506_006829 [Arthrobotrys conoides]|uniref:Uncharacterized protein n=1 Tax=Arthrobotrys conoides TaxID=74498 RepID=A0AAN8RZ19_9PEZI
MVTVLNEASITLRQYGDRAMAMRAENPGNPSILDEIKGLGFSSLDDIVHVIYRLRDYATAFARTGNRLRHFLEWLERYAILKGPNELLKHIYKASALTAQPGTIPGINVKTLAVELNTEAKDGVVETFQEVVQFLRETSNIESDEAIAWSGSLSLPKETGAMLVPEGPWDDRDLISVMEKIGGFWKCWLSPVENILRNLRKLTQPPQVQTGLQLEGRPEGNIMTGELKGWEWEEGTDTFPGLLRQDGQSKPSTRTDISELPVWEEETDMSDVRVGYLNYDPSAPIAAPQGFPNHIFPINEMIEEIRSLESLEDSPGTAEQVGGLPSTAMEEEEQYE